jgi:ribosomal protein S18 acetylase RimI-like enzyme
MLRRAQVDDLAALLVLVAEFCAEDVHPFDPAQVGDALVPLLVDDEHGQVWVHTSDAAVIDGYIVTAWSWSLESGGRECLVDELYVRDRRLGHGRALVMRALEAAREHGCRVAFLETEASNEGARDFYAGLGFEREDSVWLARPLT